MNPSTRIPLVTTLEQTERLLALQAVFSQVCNVLAPVVAQQRCWHRVTLHHLMYRQLRAQFPALGSQMICNAIYMVCKAGRLVYQSPGSPFNTAKVGADARLPTIYFKPDCPVHFDSHTLSMKAGQLSIFTMGGRMRFALQLQPAQMLQFASQRVLEITLRQREDGVHELLFVFEPAEEAVPPAPLLRHKGAAPTAAAAASTAASTSTASASASVSAASPRRATATASAASRRSDGKSAATAEPPPAAGGEAKSQGRAQPRPEPTAEPMRWPDYMSVESDIR